MPVVIPVCKEPFKLGKRVDGVPPVPGGLPEIAPSYRRKPRDLRDRGSGLCLLAAVWVELAGLAPRSDVPGHLLRRFFKDLREAVAEEVFDHPDVEVEIEGFRLLLSMEPDPSPGEVDLEIDPEQVESVIEDEGIESRLDPVGDAEFFACFDVDD